MYLDSDNNLFSWSEIFWRKTISYPTNELSRNIFQVKLLILQLFIIISLVFVAHEKLSRRGLFLTNSYGDTNQKIMPRD